MKSSSPIQSRLLALAVLFVLTLSSCATAPLPAWVGSPPPATSTEAFFTGLGSAPGKDSVKATEAATTSLVASIMMYIGVDMNVVTTSSLREEFGKISSDYSQTVSGSAANRVAGFTIVEKWSGYDASTKLTTVHILASYRRGDLEKEKARVADLLREKEDAVSRPETEGRALLARGSNWDALARFVDAAVAAAGSGIDNADIKATRNLANAREAIKSLHIELAAPATPTWVGEGWPGPFAIRLVSDSSGRGVPGANLLMSYPRKQGSRIIQKTVTATTDAEGRVSYTPPPPDFAGKAKLSVRVDFAAQNTLLDGLPQRWASAADQLREGFSTVSAEVEVSVSSRAKTQALAIALLDLDEGGAALGENVSAAALSASLGAAGFSLLPLNLATELLLSGGDEAIRAAALGLAGPSVAPRLLYGSTRLLGTRRDGSQWIAEARVTVKVIELATGRLLYSAERQVTAPGGDEAAAKRAVLREAGANSLAKDLLANLP